MADVQEVTQGSVWLRLPLLFFETPSVIRYHLINFSWTPPSGCPPPLSNWTFQEGLICLSCPWGLSYTFCDYLLLSWWGPPCTFVIPFAILGKFASLSLRTLFSHLFGCLLLKILPDLPYLGERRCNFLSGWEARHMSHLCRLLRSHFGSRIWNSWTVVVGSAPSRAFPTQPGRCHLAAARLLLSG
jgi:hypothetical protein